MRLAYKAFEPGFVCRGMKFNPFGKNVEKEANCVKNGFHCCANPLDCLSYYPDIKKSVYTIVEIGGDMDEDARDSKIAATELTIKKVLEPVDFFLHALIYMYKHPKLPVNHHVQKNVATAQGGYAIVRGYKCIARGKMGDILAFAEESTEGAIVEIAVFKVDGVGMEPDVYYDIHGREVKHDGL